MKIQSIEITNYKAFLGTHILKFGGKNVFIYGENGSGKSSLYYALKDFFQSSATIDKKRKKVTFHNQRKRYTSQDFWNALKDDLDAPLVREVEKDRDLVLNAFSHYNTGKHEIRTELTAAIRTIRGLKTALTT